MYFNRIFRFWTIHFGDPPFMNPPWSCPRTYLGWLSLPLWKMMDFVSWDDDIPNWMEKKQIHSSKPPTSIWVSVSISISLSTYPQKDRPFPSEIIVFSCFPVASECLGRAPWPPRPLPHRRMRQLSPQANSHGEVLGYTTNNRGIHRI